MIIRMSFTELEYRSILFFWVFLNSTSSGVLVCSSSWKRGACVTHGETQLLTVSCELAANVASSCFSACSRSISRIECWHSNATHLNTVADQHPAGQCASPHHKQCTTESPSPANRLDHNPIKDPWAAPKQSCPTDTPPLNPQDPQHQRPMPQWKTPRDTPTPFILLFSFTLL